MIWFLKTVRMRWYARCRRIDMEILWPTCLRLAGNLDKAKAAFLTHCFMDPAWQCLGEDAIYDFVERLEAYD